MVVRIEESTRERKTASARQLHDQAAKGAQTKASVSGENGHHHLGLRLRHARLANRMRLHDVANRAGCSLSLLSKIENNQATPSINLLHKIASALGTNMAWLLTATEEDSDVVLRKKNRSTLKFKSKEHGPGIVLQALIPSGQGHLLQGHIHIIEPGAASDGTITHEGEELGLVLEGTLDLIVDGKTYTLMAGDSFHFDSSLPHAYRNPGSSVTEVVWINTPPTY